MKLLHIFHCAMTMVFLCLFEYCLKSSLYPCTLFTIEFFKFFCITNDMSPAVMLPVSGFRCKGFECRMPVVYVYSIMISKNLQGNIMTIALSHSKYCIASGEECHRLYGLRDIFHDVEPMCLEGVSLIVCKMEEYSDPGESESCERIF